MIPSIRFEPEALGDIADAARYFDRERRGLGAEFRQAVNRRVLALRRFPNSGAPVEHVTTSLVARQVRGRQFPYLIIYVVTEDAIRVVAVVTRSVCRRSGLTDCRARRHQRCPRPTIDSGPSLRTHVRIWMYGNVAVAFRVDLCVLCSGIRNAGRTEAEFLPWS